MRFRTKAFMAAVVIWGLGLPSTVWSNIIDFDGPPTGGSDLEVTIVDMSGGFVFADGSIETTTAGVVGPAFVAANVTVYRVWARVDNALGMVSSAGGSVDMALDLVINSTNGTFVNDVSFGGDGSSSIHPINMMISPSVAWDSYVACGGASVIDQPNLVVADPAGILGGLASNVFGQNVGWALAPPSPGAGVVSDGSGGWRVLLAQLVVANGESVGGWMHILGGPDDLYYHFGVSVPPSPCVCTAGCPVNNLTQGTGSNCIQTAIDAAVSGDEIIVAPGTYNEVINFNGKAINLHSASGNPADTIIDGAGFGDSVVLCISGEGAGTILEGFTITGGTGNTSVFGGFDPQGGGMLIVESGPTVTNCIFSGNSAVAGSGGGILNAIGSNPIISNCAFSGNSAGSGGGMHNAGSGPTVNDCTFDGNSALWGGGMNNDGGSNSNVTNCSFRGNSGTWSGGGMYNLSNSNSTITNCIFSGNSTSAGGTGNGGGGVYNSTSNPTITNCTFSGNSSSSGGGILNVGASTPTVTNCVLWGASTAEIVNLNTSSTAISFSTVQGGLGAGSIDGGGNIFTDPLFIDPLGLDGIVGTADDDLRLASGSPSTDAGDNTAPDLAGITTDLDGNPRFFDDFGVGDTGNGVAPIVDMGAYERQVHSSPIIINVPSDVASIQAAISKVAMSGDEIIVAPGTYNEVINFGGKAINLHSSSGNPADTIIDGTGLSDSVVLCISGEGAGAILEGFTITGGTGHDRLGNGQLFGGGMFNEGSSPTITNCAFIGNTVTTSGGGVANFNNSSPIFTNCIFSGNSTIHGGGMSNSSSNPTVTNCTFSGNSAEQGGGMHNDGSSPTLTNCTFSENAATISGGGMFSGFSSAPTVTNCILWGDSPDEMMTASSTVTISFSNVQGGLGAGSIDGGGNFNLDPLYIDPLGTDGIPGTADDDLRLASGSPSTDAGNNSAAGLTGITTDLDGNSRFIDDATMKDIGNGIASIVDMGAYERQIDSSSTIRNVPGIYSTIQGAIIASTLSGSEIIVAPGTYPELINFGGRAINLHSSSGNPVDTILDGTGLGDSVVLCINGEGAGSILEGFTVTGGTAIAGGGMFSSESNPTINNCIFNGNSADVGGGMYNNIGSSPIITNCSFSGNTATNDGGGMNNYLGSNPTITNCTFSGNTADFGGGMYNDDHSSPTLTDCTFSGNTVTSDGGGMNNFLGSNPTITNCTFNGNTADFGGGMYNDDHSSPTLTDCTFSGNTVTSDGGGMNNFLGSSPIVTNCIFRGNLAAFGGGMYNDTDGSPVVTNCTFDGNSATTAGGGMINDTSSNPSITNCTFSGNSAIDSGGGILNAASTPVVTNCILWGDTPDEILNLFISTPTINYSNMQGGLGTGSIDGGGNIDLDPLFVDPLGPDAIPGTADDDLSLQPGSPCLDAGDNAGVPADTTDLDGDGNILEPTPLDLLSNPRFLDDPGTLDTGAGTAPIVDMGALEFTGDSGNIKFDPPSVTISAGPPNIVAVGNLDTSDGLPIFGPGFTTDVAAVIPGAEPLLNGSVQVFRNNGTDAGGTWLGLAPQPVINVGRNPTGIAIGQLNGDLFHDMVVTNAGDESIMIFMNDGSGQGTFNPPIVFSMAAGEAPLSLAIGDFNLDGLDDIAVGNGGANNLVVLDNQLGSPGTFVLGQTLALGFAPLDIDPIDVDGDKDLDLVITDGQGNTLTVVTHQIVLVGPGVFAVSATLPVGSSPVDAAVGDFDGNGFPDFASANGDGTVSIILNLNGSTFDPAFSVAIGNSPRAVDVGDFDGDLDLDLIVAADDPILGPSVQALENLVEVGGGVVFSAPISFSVGADPNFVVTADLDDDGTSDVITVNNDPNPTGGSVSVLLNSPGIPSCTGDITPAGGNGVVNIDDLVAVLNAFGPCAGCAADITPPGGNGVVNIDDLVAVLNAFGACP